MFKRKEKWISFSERKPPLGLEVIFCDYRGLWFGKLMDIEEKSTLVFVKDLDGSWVWSHKHSRPTYWKFISSYPSFT